MTRQLLPDEGRAERLAQRLKEHGVVVVE